MPTNIPQLRQFAEQVARNVGHAVLEKSRVGDFAVSFKGKLDLVTEIDLWSEREISSAIAAKFPDHLLVGEETSAKLAAERGQTLEQFCSDGMVWVVDPIDGTTNFANGLPQFCISIGLLENGRRVVGVVYDITRDEMFSAASGLGATLNGVAISVGKKSELLDSVVATGLPYDRAERWPVYNALFSSLVRKCRAVRILGSAAIDLCWVACGRLDGFCEYNLKPWDVVAGTLIVEEAGGAVSSFFADFSPYGDSFVAGNSTLLPALKSATQEKSN
jgi:myo-inositol-1(or 4)-monophosphatase